MRNEQKIENIRVLSCQYLICRLIVIMLSCFSLAHKLSTVSFPLKSWIEFRILVISLSKVKEKWIDKYPKF